MKVVVCGGGLAGLCTAHRLLELAPSLDVTVLEAAAEPGGLLGTIERDGFVIERGPDAILREKRSAIELAERLRIAHRAIETASEHRGAYVVNRGRLAKVPDGFSLLAPARAAPWWSTNIVSARGRIRALLEPMIPARDAGEESLARFVERRLGREVLERLAQPLVGGIYGGDPERLSLEATMPRFIELERRHGSVIRGLRRSESERAASGARYGLFFAFDRGMRVLIEALAARLGARLRTREAVRALERAGERWIVHGDRTLEADHVVLAAGALRSADLIAPHHERWSEALRSIPHGSAATVTMAWRRDSIPHELDAFGFVVPAVERRPVLAATFSSVKWPGRAPGGQALIRVFVGGAHASDAVERDDATLTAIARRELRALLGVAAAPHFAIVVRYRDAMPQYHLGHRRRVAAIEEMQNELGNVWLAGNALHGVGIPDTIRDAESIADAIARLTRVGATAS